MSRFIDRNDELAVLEKEYAASRSSLVILYGRRRVGKTALISEWNSQENRTPNMPGYATCACADSHRLRLTSGGR